MSSVASAASGEFLVTKEYRRFQEFADAVRRDRYIGLCYGAPGADKTLSARHYARWDLIEAAPPVYLWRGEPPAAVLPCRTVFYTAPVVRAPSKRDRDLRDLRQRLTLLVEDAMLALPGGSPRWGCEWGILRGHPLERHRRAKVSHEPPLIRLRA